MDRGIIDEYEAGVSRLRKAVDGLSEADLKARPVKGKWSTLEVMVHLADAEIVFADRMRRVIAEDEPALLAWDQVKFTARLRYEDQSGADAVEMIVLLRRQTARILRGLVDADFQRAGMHSERGRQTLAHILGAAVHHMDHHLKFVHEKRGALGKSSKDVS